jgi:hypothetical protein
MAFADLTQSSACGTKRGCQLQPWCAPTFLLQMYACRIVMGAVLGSLDSSTLTGQLLVKIV